MESSTPVLTKEHINQFESQMARMYDLEQKTYDLLLEQRISNLKLDVLQGTLTLKDLYMTLLSEYDQYSAYEQTDLIRRQRRRLLIELESLRLAALDYVKEHKTRKPV